MPGTPYTGCTDGNGDGPCRSRFLFWGAEEGRRSGRAGQPAEQSAVRFRSKALRFRPMPSRSTGASSLGGRGVFRQGNAGISSMASSLGGWGVSEPVFTAEQVGVMPGTPCGCTDGNGDGPCRSRFLFWGAEEGRRSGRAGQPAEQSAVRFRSKALRFRPMPSRSTGASSLGGWGIFRQGNAGNLKHGILSWRQGCLRAGIHG